MEIIDSYSYKLIYRLYFTLLYEILGIATD